MTKTQSWPEFLHQVTNGRPASDISKITGIGLSVITRWMNGQTKPSAKKLQELARFFPFPIDEALRVVNAYEPPRAPTRTTANGLTIWLDTDTSRTAILRYFSDLELSQEIVRRIEDRDSIEESRMLPLVVGPTPVNVGGLIEDDVQRTPEGPASGYALAAKRGRKKAHEDYAE